MFGLTRDKLRLLGTNPVVVVADDGLVFTLEGAPIDRSAFGHVWRPAAAAADLAASAGTDTHACEHYCASLLIRFGECVKTVQARLGHASSAKTLDTYSHLWPHSDDRTREAIDSVLRRPITEVGQLLLTRRFRGVRRGKRDEPACRPGRYKRGLETDGKPRKVHLTCAFTIQR